MESPSLIIKRLSPKFPRGRLDQPLIEFAMRADIQKRLALSAAAGTPETIVFRTSSKSNDAAQPEIMYQKDVISALWASKEILDSHDAPDVVLAIHVHDDEISYNWIGKN